MPDDLPENPIAPLGREEYIEQAHFFGTLVEQLHENTPAQEVLKSAREEALATARLPMAIDFMLAELRHAGAFGTAMAKLPHYFTPFQAFVVDAAEEERGRFDLRVGLDILRHDAHYRTGDNPHHPPTRQGLFLFQFEALCRNRLSYDKGLAAMAADPTFAGEWSQWILTVRRRIGMVDLADLIYVHSQHYLTRRQEEVAGSQEHSVLFGDREGRIALANRRKDPLFLFNSLHRQLGYPQVPRHEPGKQEEDPVPQIARRLEQLEKRMKLLEEEQRGGIDLSKFYQPPPGNQ